MEVMIKMSKKELKDLYINNYNKDVCDKLKISNRRLTGLLKQHGIPLKGRGRNIPGRVQIIIEG